MITSNPILGTGLHAIGGASASTCYLPNTKTNQWSWGTFWIAQALFAWIIMPLFVCWLTVPDFFTILIQAPARPFLGAFLLGASTIPFLYNVCKTYRTAPLVETDDPWGYGASLEWATSCPPPRHNFESIPRIRS